MKQRMLETELASHVISWLEGLGWDVYQEVQPRTYGPTADIVATQNGLVWVVETKMSFGLSVIAQAMRWQGWANFVSIAIPDSTRNTYDTYQAGYRCLRGLGIGCLLLQGYSDAWTISERIHPSLCRRPISHHFLDRLRPEHKTYARAGTSSSKRWTPFQATCESVRQAVKESPGLSMKELFERIEHHYHSTSTARSCIKKWTEAGRIDGVRLEREGRYLRLWPAEKA